MGWDSGLPFSREPNIIAQSQHTICGHKQTDNFLQSSPFFFGEVWVKVSENNQHTVESAFAVSSVDGLCHPCFYYLSSREFDFLCIRRTQMKRDSKQAAV